jgi:hypothetical protein
MQATVMTAIEHTALELKLPTHCGTYSLQCASQPATPHVEIFNVSDPAHRAATLRAPFFKLAPEDVALLDSDPARRQRYMELVTYSWMPPLRRMAELIATQVRQSRLVATGATHRVVESARLMATMLRVQGHLHETSVGTAELAALMPNAGLDWKGLFGKGSGLAILHFIRNYVGHLESLLARWQSDDLGLLQPEMPCPCYFAGFMFLLNHFAVVGKREVELTGQSVAGQYADASSVADRFASTEAQT